MKKTLFAICVAAWVTAGLFSSLSAQESRGGPPSLTPEERRERWRELRNMSAEERAERLREMREERRAARAEAEKEALGPPPEEYLDQLAFRSIVSLGGITEFTLHNPYEDRSFVISAEEGQNGIEVVNFDAETNALTVSREGDKRTLSLQASRVTDFDVFELAEEEENRRDRWQGRRERLREFRETWEEAAKESPKLQEIESQFRELVGDYRRQRSALRDAEPGSAEHEKLQKERQEMREEFRLLTEYSVLEVRQNPAFEGHDTESLERTMRMMMYRQGGERGRRGRGLR